MEVRNEPVHKLRLPQVLVGAALVLVRLRSCGVLAQAAERVRVDRPGFCGVDALVYLILHFFSTPHAGLRDLWATVGTAREKLGILAGRDSVMSRSALSRLLGTVSETEVGRFARWLLLEATGVMDVMRSEVAQIVDAQGSAWRVFAFDPVRLAIRHRGLPEGEELPPPNRRTRRLVAPGRTGRKRGEVVCTAAVLEDLGSSAVLDVQLSPGNGDRRSLFEQAVRAVLATLAVLTECVARTILLADGEFGTVPYVSMCVEHGLPFITRCARYELLHDPVIWDRLCEARWERVEDSKSGPVRYAAEVGTVRLAPGVTTRRDDGGRYDPVEVRLVVSRFATDGQRGCGRQIDGWRYELYVIQGVSPASFAAADVVALFYARCGQECSFQQHERDLGVQRVFSTNPAGQLFAWVVAFFVWNLRLAMGVQLSPPLPRRTAPSQRHVELGNPPARPTHLEATDTDSDAADEQAESAPTAPSPEPDTTAQNPQPEPHDALAAALAQLNWDHALRRRPGWSWDPGARGLRNAENHLLRFVGVEWTQHRAKLRFMGADRRQSTIAVVPRIGRVIDQALREQPGRRCRSAPVTGDDPQAELEVEAAPSESDVASSFIAATDDEHLPYAIGWPELLRAAARKVLPQLAAEADVRVRIHPTRTRKTHPLVEPSRARRQHRRLTWNERLARHAAHRRSTVTIRIPSDELASWLRTPPANIQPGRPTM